LEKESIKACTLTAKAVKVKIKIIKELVKKEKF
jgi:hypothetical protein